MTPLLIAFLALLFFANLDKLEFFRASKSGFEAKTRKLDETVVKAENTIEELQELSKMTAWSTLSSVITQGRTGGFSDQKKEEVLQSTKETLRNLGIEQNTIDQIVENSLWHQFTEFDYVLYILGGSTIPQSLPRDKIQAWKELRHRELHNIARPEELTAFIQECNLLTPEIQKLIEDYRYYIEFRKHRRPEVWAKRNEWEYLK